MGRRRNRKTVSNSDKVKLDEIEKPDCPYDNGGYFIIGGREKVIVAQERQSENKLFIKKSKLTDETIVESEIRSMPHDKFQPARVTRIKILRELPSDKNGHNPIRIEIPGIT